MNNILKSLIIALAIFLSPSAQAGFFKTQWKDISSTWENVKDTGGKAWEDTKTAATKAWEDTKTAATKAWEDTKDAGTKAWEDIQKAERKAWEDFRNEATRATNGLKANIAYLKKNIAIQKLNLDGVKVPKITEINVSMEKMQNPIEGWTWKKTGQGINKWWEAAVADSTWVKGIQNCTKASAWLHACGYFYCEVGGVRDKSEALISGNETDEAKCELKQQTYINNQLNAELKAKNEPIMSEFGVKIESIKSAMDPLKEGSSR